MNEMKKMIYMQGALLTPLVVGNCAFIAHGGRVIRTSRIVAIDENNGLRASFETLNSRYYIELAPVPISTAMPAYSRCVAA